MRGGARMKISRILCTVALVGFSLGLSAAVAHADGTDPTVIVNRTKTDPVCTPDTDVDCLTSTNTLALNLNGSTTIDIGGSEDIFSLSITFPGLANGQYQCFTNIFVNCFQIFTVDP